MQIFSLQILQNESTIENEGNKKEKIRKNKSIHEKNEKTTRNTYFNYLQKYVNILVVFVQEKCFPLIFTYVTWKRKRVRGSVWKSGSEIFKKIRKRVRVGSVSIYIYIYTY